jgi:hypothetical protein
MFLSGTCPSSSEASSQHHEFADDAAAVQQYADDEDRAHDNRNRRTNVGRELILQGDAGAGASYRAEGRAKAADQVHEHDSS